jgi:predicted glycosyl hydrolase (DUF1957 family)
MKPGTEDQFETLESAHDFVALLAETVADAKRELESDILRESASNWSRRLDALRIALYGVRKLEHHVNRTSRILNDLRTLRRLLFEERRRTNATQSATPLQKRTVGLSPNSLVDETQLFAATLQKSLAA